MVPRRPEQVGRKRRGLGSVPVGCGPRPRTEVGALSLSERGAPRTEVSVLGADLAPFCLRVKSRPERAPFRSPPSGFWDPSAPNELAGVEQGHARARPIVRACGENATWGSGPQAPELRGTFQKPSFLTPILWAGARKPKSREV